VSGLERSPPGIAAVALERAAGGGSRDDDDSTRRGRSVMSDNGQQLEWFRVAEADELPRGRVMTVTAGTHVVVVRSHSDQINISTRTVTRDACRIRKPDATRCFSISPNVTVAQIWHTSLWTNKYALSVCQP
ncbi:MAG: hypothetical protein ACE10G_05715, partial [Gemmatimonadales bacterium]